MNKLKGIFVILLTCLFSVVISFLLLFALVSVSENGFSIEYFIKNTDGNNETTSDSPSEASSSQASQPDNGSAGSETASTGDDSSQAVEITTASDEPQTETIPDTTYPQEFISIDDSYFEDAVFMGDSRMQGFIKYCGISGLRTYAYVGLDVDKYFTSDVFRLGDSKLTASQALELDRSFGKVYIMFGTNELGWVYPDIFIEKFGAVIDHIKQCNPDAVVFVCSILPVSKDAYKSRSYLKNDKVRSYNELLSQMCVDKEAYYLDIASVVADENGNLPDDAAPDGIHLNSEYVQKCLAYMKEHGIFYYRQN